MARQVLLKKELKNIFLSQKQSDEQTFASLPEDVQKQEAVAKYFEGKGHTRCQLAKAIGLMEDE